MFKKNTKTILASLVVILLIVVGVYALTNKNNQVNDTNVPGNENNAIDDGENEDLQNKEDIDISPEDQGRVTTYLENNISVLSPEEAVLEGTFYVTTVGFPEENVVIVNYEDGYIALTAKADYILNTGEVEITSFELLENNDMSDDNINDEEGISVENQGKVTTYLENNISVLSPEEAVLGGTFYVTTVSFPEENVAIVNYEDGHIALTAKADFSVNSSNEVEINLFELIPDGSTVERNGNNDADICVDMCGDGVCQEIVCMGEGCPCPETAQNCPADCF
jgi:ubiquitin-protein ligase